MNGKFWLGIGSGALLTALLLILFGDVRFGFTESSLHEFRLHLEVLNNEKKVKIKKNKKVPCPPGSPSKWGCLDVAANEEAEVIFELPSSSSWFISEMIICKGNNKNHQDCSLDQDDIDQFSATKVYSNNQIHPAANGVIPLYTFSGDRKAFKFNNGNEVEGDYFYTIQVCPDDGGHGSSRCIETDPGIRNGGKNMLN